MSCDGIFGGWVSPTCYIESWSSALTRGLGMGAGQGAAEVIKEVINEVIEKSFTNVNVNTDGVGTRFGEFIAKEWNNFATAAGLDASTTATKLSQLSDEFLKNIDSKKFGENLGDLFDKGWDGMDMSGRAGEVGADIKDAMNSFTFEIGEGFADSFRNMATGIRNEFLFNQLPYVLGGSMAISLTATGFPLFLYYLYYKAKFFIGRPKLATEVNKMNLLKTLASPITAAASLLQSKVVKPSFDNAITRRISEISKAVQNIRKNGGYFQNVLFYGPGGTGKTMISHLLAQESGMSYVKMSGGDLAQYIKRGEHVTELNKLFDMMETSWRPWSTRPWLLFIDEAESLCKDRGTLPSSELLELQNAFLNRTGTQSKKFMLVMATNRVEDLDPAVLNRMDHKVYIGPPATVERRRIIETYLPQFFSSSERSRLFTAQLIDTIAQRTEGFTGRSLFKLLNAVANHRAMTETNVLTDKIILQTLDDFVRQEAEIKQRFKDKETADAAKMAPQLRRQA